MPPKKRPSATKHVVDQAWFKAKLADVNKSMREMQKSVGMDVSAISRTFSGERKMQMAEATKIAQFLGTHVTEVLRHAGVQIDSDDQASRIMLAATIDEDGKVERILEPKALPRHVIDRANAAITIKGGGNVIAAQVRALDGPLAMFDDAVLLFGHTDTVESDAIGSLSICRNREGGQILAKIERARKTGEALLICPDGSKQEFSLRTAAPIIAIIP